MTTTRVVGETVGAALGAGVGLFVGDVEGFLVGLFAGAVVGGGVWFPTLPVISLLVATLSSKPLLMILLSSSWINSFSWLETEEGNG